MITVQEYLNSKSIEFATENGQLRTKCLFSGCDEKTKHKGHLYFEKETGVYICHHCGEKGNLLTLAQFLGDDPREVGILEKPVKIGKVVKGRAKKLTQTIKPEDLEAWHDAMPPEIRDWLVGDRGLTEEVLASALIGWDGRRIVIPVFDASGNCLFAKRRRSPSVETGPKYKYPKGAKAALFGEEYLAGSERIIICEGELDALLLRSKGIPAVTSTGGSKTFLEEWVEKFTDIANVHIVYDNDNAGREGALKVGAILPHAKISTLPVDVGEGGDVTDYFKLGNTVDDLYELLKQGKTLEEIEQEGERFVALPKPSRKVDLEAWRSEIKSRFPECLAASEVGLAVLTQLLIKDVRNPFGLVYVDVPSAGKTITLNFFSAICEVVYTTDNFSPASLVSHASNRKREDLEKIDLLPRIRHKMLIVRDLAPLFAERQENLLKNLGVLTRVFDGEGYESDSGVHGKRGYKGDYTFMFLAGSTPIAPRVWKFMGNLGSRLFFLNLNTGDKTEEELADLLIQEDFKKKENACRDVTRDFLLNIWEKHSDGVLWDKEDDPPELRRIISRCAKLLAHLRGTLNVWKDGDEGGKHHYTNRVIEKPMRINQLLYNLARAHALVCGRTRLSEADMWPVIEVTFNSAQYNRINLLNTLIENGGTVNTSLVEWSIGCSTPTALKEIETFRVLEIVDVEDVNPDGKVGRPERLVHIKDEFDWFCSDECQRLRTMRPE